MNRRLSHFFLLAAIMLFAATLRLFRLGEAPPGLFLDEMAEALNGLLIARTGLDQFGNPFPIFFRALDDYRCPLFEYSLAAVLQFLPVSEWSVRLPAALYGLLGVLAIYFLGRALLGSSAAGLWSSFFLASLPWHVHFSRICWQAITFPLFFTLTLLMLRNYFAKPSTHRAAAAGAVLAATLYTYVPAKLLCAVVAAVAGVMMLRRKQFFALGVFSSALILIGLPYVAVYLQQADSINLRFHAIAIPLREVPLAYLSHFSPQFLFTTGDFQLRHNPAGGMCDWFLVPFFLLAVYDLVRQPTAEKRLVVILTLLLPLLSALSSEYPHATRTLVMTPILALLATIGALRLHHILRGQWWQIGAVVALCVLSTAPRWRAYFGPQDALTHRVWDSGQFDALQQLARLKEPDEVFYATPAVSYIGWMLVSPPSREELMRHRPDLNRNYDRYDPLDLAGKFDFLAIARSSNTLEQGWMVLSTAEYEQLSETAQSHTTVYYKNDWYVVVKSQATLTE